MGGVLKSEPPAIRGNGYGGPWNYKWRCGPGYDGPGTRELATELERAAYCDLLKEIESGSGFGSLREAAEGPSALVEEMGEVGCPKMSLDRIPCSPALGTCEVGGEDGEVCGASGSSGSEALVARAAELAVQEGLLFNAVFARNAAKAAVLRWQWAVEAVEAAIACDGVSAEARSQGVPARHDVLESAALRLAAAKAALDAAVRQVAILEVVVVELGGEVGWVGGV